MWYKHLWWRAQLADMRHDRWAEYVLAAHSTAAADASTTKGGAHATLVGPKYTRTGAVAARRESPGGFAGRDEVWRLTPCGTWAAYIFRWIPAPRSWIYTWPCLWLICTPPLWSSTRYESTEHSGDDTCWRYTHRNDCFTETIYVFICSQTREQNNTIISNEQSLCKKDILTYTQVSIELLWQTKQANDWNDKTYQKKTNMCETENTF